MTKIAAVEIQVAPEPMTPYLRIMKIWTSWISLADRQEAGGWSHPQDAKEFMRCGEAVDVMINDLPRVCKWAIHKAQGIAPGVWRFPDTSFADALLDAEEKLTPKMRNNIDTRRYFP
ncbi:hypothetical protein [Massilia sp. PWRC2]|uniref:hypothetical protein n=1 Tax=Massilia sp. PWRC2 TaxID=2804626 RepID=UPI003CF2AC04